MSVGIALNSAKVGDLVTVATAEFFRRRRSVIEAFLERYIAIFPNAKISIETDQSSSSRNVVQIRNADTIIARSDQDGLLSSCVVGIPDCHYVSNDTLLVEADEAESRGLLYAAPFLRQLAKATDGCVMCGDAVWIKSGDFSQQFVTER